MYIITAILGFIGDLIAAAFDGATSPDGIFYKIGQVIGLVLMFLAGVAIGYVGIGVIHGLIIGIKALP